MAFFEELSGGLKQKWLQYYQANRSWLVLQMNVQSVQTPDGGRRPPSYLILGVLNALEPNLEQLMLPFSRLNPDPEVLIDVLGLNFDPEKALGISPEADQAATSKVPSPAVPSVPAPSRATTAAPPTPVEPEPEKDSSNLLGAAGIAAVGAAAGLVGGAAIASTLAPDEFEVETTTDEEDLGFGEEEEESAIALDDDLGLGDEEEESAIALDEEMDLGDEDEESTIALDDDLGLGDEEEEAIALDDDLGLGDEEEEAIALDDDLGLGDELEESSSELDAFRDMEEDAADDFGLSDSEEEDLAIANPFEEESSEFVAEDIPDPFAAEASDDLDMGLGDLGDEDDFGDFATSDDLDEMGLDALGEATTGDPDEADLDALGLGEDDEDDEISGFLSDFK
ncbi:MAG: DUF5331 domain-containing protein [Actinomycetota bacterium]